MGMDRIEHVVVLMLENRSFDSMLGWLYESDEPSHTIGPPGPFRGLQNVDLSKFTNTALGGTLTFPPKRGADGFIVPTADPGEEYRHVNRQFWETPDDQNPDDTKPPTMTGVLADFVKVLDDEEYKPEDIKRLAPTIMQTYTPAQLPVLNQLARHYAVCDDWFASVPSQTNPNRAFLLCVGRNGQQRLPRGQEEEPRDRGDRGSPTAPETR
jgi:phospholipase C